MLTCAPVTRPLRSMPEFTFLPRPESLDVLLSGCRQIGVDTEFLREKTYYAELCLVQLATPDEIVCIDLLAEGNHTEFWKSVLARDWVVHSARQDIEIVWQAAGTMPASLFDTQIAAGLLGYPAQMGYAGLVEALFDVQMAKTHTRADWSKRPLREALLQYAAEDVEYLLPAAEILTARLEAAGRLEWAREDSELLLDPALYDVSELDAVGRLKGARNLRGRQRAAAARLAAWREAEAVRVNRPRQWIAKDSVLLEVARRLPATPAVLGDVAGLPARLVERAGRQLLDAVAESAGDRGDYEPPQRPNEAQKALLAEMQARVARQARELGIAAEIIAARKELAAIAVSGTRESRVLRGWRGTLVGDELLALL